MFDDLLCDFEFSEESDRAGALALILTPLARGLLDDARTPLFVVDAPRAGTGKTLLAHVSNLLATGRPAAASVAPTTDEEWRKRITAEALDPPQVMLIDNVEREVRSEALAAAVTSGLWRDRLLGQSSAVTLPQRSMIVVTGNNVRLGGDIPRRTVRIRMDAKTPRPWERSGWRHPDLEAFVLERRRSLVEAALTMLAAGAAGTWTGLPSLAGFDRWARVIGLSLAAAEMPGFLDNQAALWEEHDSASVEWAGFLCHLHSAAGSGHHTARSLVGAIQNLDLDTALPSSLSSLDLTAKGAAQRLGVELRKQRDVRFECTHGEVWVARAADSRSKAATWTLHHSPRGSAGAAGIAGARSSPRRSDESTEIEESRSLPVLPAPPAAPSCEDGQSGGTP